jgi:uncharacterized integral membrane protein
MTCTSQHLGYGTTADHVQCALAHTGLALWPLILLGLLAVVGGVLLYLLVRDAARTGP